MHDILFSIIKMSIIIIFKSYILFHTIKKLYLNQHKVALVVPLFHKLIIFNYYYYLLNAHFLL